jgi:putative membrane protein
MYGWGGDSWGIVGWVAMAVLMIVFWGGVITAIVFALRRPRSDYENSHPLPSHDGAERILHERFARGEIDQTEYLARRSVLRQQD